MSDVVHSLSKTRSRWPLTEKGRVGKKERSAKGIRALNHSHRVLHAGEHTPIVSCVITSRSTRERVRLVSQSLVIEKLVYLPPNLSKDSDSQLTCEFESKQRHRPNLHELVS